MFGAGRPVPDSLWVDFTIRDRQTYQEIRIRHWPLAVRDRVAVKDLFWSLRMSSPQTALQILDRHYLEIRSKILDLAASLDRIGRAPDQGGLSEDPRVAKLQAGLTLLLAERADRAEQVQMLFSDAYAPGWLQKK